MKISKPSEAPSQNSDPTWGMFINREGFGHGRYSNCPDWAKPLQREKWDIRGLILWDKNTCQITRLWAEQALNLLNDMNRSEDWKELGITVGEPAYQICLDEAIKGKHKLQKEAPAGLQEGKWILTDTIDLTPAQSQAFFEFLQHNEKQLLEVADHEDRERGMILSNVYRLLLGDELWHMIAMLYQANPEEAKTLGIESVRMALA